MDVFDETNTDYEQSRERLQQAVSEKAYHTLRSSILNAHYTPPALAEAIWEPVREAAAGQESLRVLEPGSGTGMFFRTSGLAGSETPHQFVGVEVDETTARISSLLHPEAEIHHMGFEQTRFDESSFDLTIGNVPFGDWALPDARHNTAGLSLHNHFIYKSLAHTAPGGYVAVMTSRYTMDSKTETARRAMAKEGDLVGAVRLPEGAHRELSGTEVGTDVLIFRRRDPDEPAPKELPEWVSAGTSTVMDRDGVPQEVNINNYFLNNPQRVLGTVEFSSNPFGPGYQVKADPQQDLPDAVRAQITQITTETDLPFAPERDVAPAFTPGIQQVPVAEARFGHVRYNSETQRFEEYASTMEWAKLPNKFQPTQAARAETLALLNLRDGTRNLIEAQRGSATPEERAQLREQLHQDWQSYVGQHGPVNRREEIKRTPTKTKQAETITELKTEWVLENQPDLNEDEITDEVLATIDVPEDLMEQWESQASEKFLAGYSQKHLKTLRHDPSLGVLLAVERIDYSTGEATPAAMLTQDVVSRVAQATSAETAEEAIGISMAERGHIDTERIGELLGLDATETAEALEGQVFTDPATEQVESATRYLSGDVRAKLKTAEEAAQSNPDFEANAAALRGVLPEEIELEEITINPGVPWLQTRIYEQFAAETFGVPVEITYNPHNLNGKWKVETPSAKPSEDIMFAWGTNNRSAKPWSVLEKTLNSQVFRLTKEDPTDSERRIPDPKGSDAANDKADQLKARFREWIGEDPDRAAAVQNRYNELFNSMVPADYSSLSQSLELPGLAADRSPYSYQRTAVARALNEPAVLFDHVVGAGKTGSMIMTAMEKRRLGHANKPALVVPGHLVGQITAEWKQWYPTAEVMAIPGGLGLHDRREMFARAAAGDWDAVIMADTVFEDIGIDPVRHQSMLEEDIAQARLAATTMENDGASRSAVRRAERAVKSLESTYDKLGKKSDNGLVFEQTGVDFLMVDEAHHYKNLARSSDVPELEHTPGAQRAQNLDYILRAMREDRVSRAKAEGTWAPGYIPSVALFSTGTPVANKVSEMWVMQHYLRPDLLAERNIEDVNAWGATFTEQDWRVIATPDGRYQRALKVTGFANVPELLAFNRSFQDSVSRTDLEVPLPAVIGGERQLKTAPPSPEIEAFMVSLQDRVDRIKDGSVDPAEDNVLKIVHEGRMAALDPRLMGMEAPEDGGRPVMIANEIMRIHRNTEDNVYPDETGQDSPNTGGLQIVFADLSTPKADRDEFTIYQQLKNELIDRGMDADKISFIHDAANDDERVEIYRKAREGEINVLVGSTLKMGTGMNVQRRAVGLHHVDPPWKPADMEQREGRILRQGNLNEQVEILAYGAEGTTDTFMWSKLSQKASFIDQLKTARNVGRTMEDPLAGLDATAANAQAVLSGDPRIGELLTLESEITTMERLEHSHHAEMARARASVRFNQEAAERYDQRLPQLRELASKVTSTRGDRFAMTLPNGQLVTERGQAAEFLSRQAYQAATLSDAETVSSGGPVPVGTLGGVALSVYQVSRDVHIATSVEGHDTTARVEAILNGNKSPEGLLKQTENLLAGTEEKIGKWEAAREFHQQEADKLQNSLGGPWARAEELESKRRQYEELKAEMGFFDDDDEQADTAPAKLSADELTALWGEDRKLDGHLDVRDGDVIRMKDGPHGSGFYHVKVGDPEDTYSGRAEIWPDEGTEDMAEPMPYIYASQSSGVLLASRQRASLTPMETAKLSIADDPQSRVIRTHQLETGMKVQVLNGETQEMVTAHITRDPEIHGHRGLVIVPEDPEIQRSNVYDGWAKPAEGFIQLNYQAPQMRADDGKVYPAGLGYGVQLTEDVEGLGKEGDLLVTRPGRFMSGTTCVMDPETGTAKELPTRLPRLSPEQFSQPVMLNPAEKQRLGLSPNGADTVEVRALRPGDEVIWRDIDKYAASGEPVTVTGLGGYHSSKTDVSFNTPHGEPQRVEITDTREVRMTGRARANLTTTELAQLQCASIVMDPNDAEAPFTRGARSTDIETLASAEERGAVIGTDNPDVILTYWDNKATRVVAGRLASIEKTPDDIVRAQVVNDAGDEIITAQAQHFREVTISSAPLDVSDLNISGAPPAPSPESEPPAVESSTEHEQYVALQQQQLSAASAVSTVETH